jgi:hypothetical protein
MSPVLRRTTSAALLVLAPVALVIAWLVARPDLGERIATHFTLGGRADGFGSAGSFVALMTGISLVTAAVGVLVVLRAGGGSTPRPYVAVVAFTSWIVCTTSVAVLLAGRDVAPGRARSGWGDTLVSVLVALVLATAAALLLPPATSRVARTPLPTPGYELRPGERAIWIGTAHSQALVVASVVVAVVGAATLPVQATIGVTTLVIAILLAWLHSLTVRVDSSGLTAHFGPLAWPRVHVDLEDVDGISAQEIEPLRWGGWGYRFTRRGTALVVRRGPGLVIGRRGGSDLAITVDDPDGAAELVAALRRSPA